MKNIFTFLLLFCLLQNIQAQKQKKANFSSYIYSDAQIMLLKPISGLATISFDLGYKINKHSGVGFGLHIENYFHSTSQGAGLQYRYMNGSIISRSEVGLSYWHKTTKEEEFIIHNANDGFYIRQEIGLRIKKHINIGASLMIYPNNRVILFEDNIKGSYPNHSLSNNYAYRSFAYPSIHIGFN